MLERLIENFVPLLYLIFFLPISIYFIKLLRDLKNPSSHRARMIAVAGDNTAAIQENNVLLRELIALNRQYLEREHKANS